MSRARDLRHSGSDIVVEEDLANIFGRCRISLTLTSSFKTIVTKSTSNVPLLERIMLQGGPGPTVIRAFHETPYFAMVVQLSLLVWTFHAPYLATAIADALRKRLEGAPSSSVLQASPDRQGILGVLYACESQTSAFNWNMLLNAVSTTLGYKDDTAPIDFPPFVLQGLFDMFPMVQTLPCDRFIHIQIPVGEDLDSGVSTLVVWAHHVLDLTVLVRPRGNDGQATRNVRFGGSDFAQVFIEEAAATDDASIVMLDSRKEHLLKIRPEPDAEGNLIGSVRRVPARGWGNALLSHELGHLQSSRIQSQAVIEDLQTVTSAFAFSIAKNLVKDDTDRYDDLDTAEKRRQMIYTVNEQNLLQASRFLFDNPRISHGTIKSFVTQYSSKALDERLPQPLALKAASRANVTVDNHDKVMDDEWNIICGTARRLSVFLLALAHVNLEDCEDLMFAGFAFRSMFEHALTQQLEEWDGKGTLRVRDDAWLQAVAIPLLGHRNNVWNLGWDRVCAISHGGWSAWILTFEDSDPAYVSMGSVRIGRGSPCRNGVWKLGIRDSIDNVIDLKTDPERAESCGQVSSLRCAEKVTLDSPYCGEGDDVFVICARLRCHKTVPSQKPVQRVGYKALQKYLWWAQLSNHCTHGSRRDEGIKLAIGCATIAGFGNYLEETDERILIWLTAHSVGARWLALATVYWIRFSGTHEVEDSGLRQILLRRDDCCFQCAIDQAAAQPGKWLIIL
ncbi:hypothetical protein IMSHALPRED_005210 [Imshaugia aleurites]|uniref:Uncharacterized protein n=1 Tax=Imshaugia aleurites TaxID=172621 RepID=A0A8H3FDJ2_9LECA|nr:hypothetical protein IMSHALPRED_005210 [Imshaugia aleurites]